MTPHQKGLARHALGLPNGEGRSYRNRYIAVPGTREYGSWDDMVGAGEAIKTPGEEMGIGACDHFRLTKTAATATLEPDEKLDLEDFPE